MIECEYWWFFTQTQTEFNTKMETNSLKHYGILTRKEYEENYYEIRFDHFQKQESQTEENVINLIHTWKVQTVKNTYPKTHAQVRTELYRRGLDPGTENYGLVRVIEMGEVEPENGLWTADDVDVAVIALAELDCVAPWIQVCKSFNIKPVEYIKAMRTVAEENVPKLGQYADEPLFYRFEFAFGDNLLVSGSLKITLRDDWQRVLQKVS